MPWPGQFRFEVSNMSKTLKIINGDVVRSFTNQGYSYVSETAKARQDIALMLTSSIRTITGLGCGLDDLIGSDPTNEISQYSIFPILFDFQTRIKSGLNRLKSAQRNYSYAYRTPKELIYDFSSAEIWQTPEDPRNYKFRVDVITDDGSTRFSVGGGAKI